MFPDFRKLIIDLEKEKKKGASIKHKTRESELISKNQKKWQG